ncbi:hypothetical protein ACVBEF_17845 [Glaciimonas sp. GG7]
MAIRISAEYVNASVTCDAFASEVADAITDIAINITIRLVNQGIIVATEADLINVLKKLYQRGQGRVAANNYCGPLVAHTMRMGRCLFCLLARLVEF